MHRHLHFRLNVSSPAYSWIQPRCNHHVWSKCLYLGSYVVFSQQLSPMVRISYILLCLTKEKAGLDTHTMENLNLRFEVLVCLLLEFPCDLHFATISNVMCKDDVCKQSITHFLRTQLDADACSHTCHSFNSLLRYHFCTSLLIPSVFHVYVHIILRRDKHLLLKLHVMLFCYIPELAVW